jgi:hypothetical protein
MALSLLIQFGELLDQERDADADITFAEAFEIAIERLTNHNSSSNARQQQHQRFRRVEAELYARWIGGDEPIDYTSTPGTAPRCSCGTVSYWLGQCKACYAARIARELASDGPDGDRSPVSSPKR